MGQLWCKCWATLATQNSGIFCSIPFFPLTIMELFSYLNPWQRNLRRDSFHIKKSPLRWERAKNLQKSPKISHIKISSQVGEGKAEEGSKAVLAKSVKLVQSLKADLTTAGSRWWLVMGRFFISEISKGLQICPIQTLNRTCNVIYFIKGITKTFPPNYPTHLSTNLPIYLP